MYLNIGPLSSVFTVLVVLELEYRLMFTNIIKDFKQDKKKTLRNEGNDY